MINPESLLTTLQIADKAWDLGGKLVEFVRQRHPELDTRPVPDAGAEMDDAKAEALRRAKED